MTDTETICAVTTAPGGAVGVLRVSGPEADAVCGAVWRGRRPLAELPPRMLTLGTVHDAAGRTLDSECLAVRMPGPHSYTGEDVVELQCHGGALCVRLTLAALLAAGCRSAEPGEFTRRAFLNGRLDLTQAEAVADVIGAQSQAALLLAGRQLQGRLGRRLTACYEALADLLADLESRLDFPEEELEWRPAEELAAVVTAQREELAALLATRRAGEILRGGLRLAITGCPNVGKSSLLNAMLGRDRAIVTDVPGTTRDTIEEGITVRGIPLQLIDTAGIRDGGDAIERTGMERARASAEAADIVLWVRDATVSAGQEWPGWAVRGQVVTVVNKLDMVNGVLPAGMPAGAVGISAVTGAGLEELYDAIEQCAGLGKGVDCGGDIAVAERHAALLEEALAGSAEVPQLLIGGEWELAAVGLRTAVAAVGRIIGRETEPDVLETIFHRFCIGK